MILHATCFYTSLVAVQGDSKMTCPGASQKGNASEPPNVIFEMRMLHGDVHIIRKLLNLYYCMFNSLLKKNYLHEAASQPWAQLRLWTVLPQNNSKFPFERNCFAALGAAAALDFSAWQERHRLMGAFSLASM